MRRQLQDVLDEAHSSHVYISDKDNFGKVDHWQPGLKGDCEDFALWCRERLAAQGIESDLIFCLTELGGGHLVLSVDGNILDNRQRLVKYKDEMSYTWLKLGQPNGIWVKITG